jgi:hypothetical protein
MAHLHCYVRFYTLLPPHPLWEPLCACDVTSFLCAHAVMPPLHAHARITGTRPVLASSTTWYTLSNLQSTWYPFSSSIRQWFIRVCARARPRMCVYACAFVRACVHACVCVCTTKHVLRPCALCVYGGGGAKIGPSVLSKTHKCTWFGAPPLNQFSVPVIKQC